MQSGRFVTTLTLLALTSGCLPSPPVPAPRSGEHNTGGAACPRTQCAAGFPISGAAGSRSSEPERCSSTSRRTVHFTGTRPAGGSSGQGATRRGRSGAQSGQRIGRARYSRQSVLHDAGESHFPDTDSAGAELLPRQRRATAEVTRRVHVENHRGQQYPASGSAAGPPVLLRPATRRTDGRAAAAVGCLLSIEM